jgi:glyoxylase-like metal-dependent hydrolase (beta-lactamase superfamily II)
MPFAAAAQLAALSLATTLASSSAFARCGCPADIDGDGSVGVADLTGMIVSWGPCGPECPADLDEDGVVGAVDLVDLVLAWGPCGPGAGSFPEMWIDGGACGLEPDIQVHQYDADTYILRQSLCTNFEGPFMYLLFGQDRVLMQDTGATSSLPIAGTVSGIIDEWLERNGRASIELVVTHSHGHGDHYQGDGQFSGQPDTQVVGLGVSSVASFFGIDGWPEQIVAYDLGGGRVVDVIPIPGHQSAHVALYDRDTGLLLTGDSLYPGRLYISSFPQYMTSIQRLVDFTSDKPVCHVLGTHIEMTNTPGVDFPFGSTHHPDEHPLQLGREHLVELLDALVEMQDDPHVEEHDDFIIWPF